MNNFESMMLTAIAEEMTVDVTVRLIEEETCPAMCERTAQIEKTLDRAKELGDIFFAVACSELIEDVIKECFDQFCIVKKMPKEIKERVNEDCLKSMELSLNKMSDLTREVIGCFEK